MSGAIHLIQRARSACLADTCDRLAFLDFLVTFGSHCECRVHAYVLMPNHVHVLLTAPNAKSASEFDKWLRKPHEGSDSELRPIYARRYLLGCMRYIELNPVRAKMLAAPAEYRWSSYRANALGYRDPAVSPHALYYALGRSPQERQRTYTRFVEQNRFGAVSP